MALAFLSGACAAEPALPPDAVLPVEPLSSLASRADPNLVIDLALKESNAGAAWRGGFDQTRVHLGHWDPMGCYGYAGVDGYFRRVATATRLAGGEIACRHQWSGNLLNWAASSRLDVLRLALTGGDRVIDEADRTVLQRAVLPPGFYRSADFPGKSVSGHLDQLTPLVVERPGELRATDTVYFSNCLDRLFVGASASGRCASPGSDQQYGPGGASAPYLARVEVCTPAEAESRPDLCVKYPSGNHKPVGAVQAHADPLRLAVFGYLLDNDVARYGGVLRAPMKYTGPLQRDTAFDSSDNPQAEWDAKTGVFKPNPLDAQEGYSGVIPSINRFGRSGAYRKFDPAGELFYESLRYLQGKAPTPRAMAGVVADDARKDGLPVHAGPADWRFNSGRARDPVTASCQRNFILSIGDLETHSDRSLPGLPKGSGRGDFDRGFNVANFEPDTAHWTRLVGAFENAESLAYAHPSGKPGLMTLGNRGLPAFNYKGGARLTSSSIAGAETGADQGSFGMAGLAYWASTQKIRSDHPDLRVQSFAIDLDARGDGAIGQGQRGSALYLAAKYGGFVDGNDDGNPFLAAGVEGRPSANNDAEWAEGIDSEGRSKPANYFLAGEPRQTVAAIRGVFARALAPPDAQRTSAVISADGGKLYVSRFGGRRGSGTLVSHALSPGVVSGIDPKVEEPEWDAGALLTGDATARPAIAPRAPSTRNIFTRSASGVGVEFLWESLDAAFRRDLDTTPCTRPAATDDLGNQRLAYLRGDRSRELSAVGGVFRVRDSVMGGVAHSAVLAVGAPSRSIPDAGYPAFLATHRSREPAVYVGANDGMLHAFSASTGRELFAYVPRALSPKLAAHASADCGRQSYVDGSPAAAEARMADGSWRTVLVSGMGGGAKGVFALDVSDPARFSAGSVMWEFGRDDDSDMGHVFQPPRLLKFRTAAATRDRPATYGWFAVVPSGFNNAHPHKRAALFLLSLDKPAGAAWRLGVNYHKILLPRPADDSLVNALAATPGDYATSDGSALWLYGGDTQGNLWKFDFSGDAPWTEANALAFKGRPLMVALDGEGAAARRQPITVAPVIGLGPKSGAIVLFGTGKFMSPEDLGRKSHRVQTLYGVLDDGTPIPNGEARAQLQPRKPIAAPGPALVGIGGDAFAYGGYDRQTASRRGWYFDLPGSVDLGERLVSAHVLADGQLFFNTLIPSARACEGEGAGRSCAVDAMTGLSQGGTCVPSERGPLGAPLLVQQGDAVLGAADGFGRRSTIRRLSVVNTGTRGSSGPGLSVVQPLESGRTSQMAGRLSWRQVNGHRGTKP